MKKAKVIDNSGFNYISLGTVYNIEKETRDYYYITNDVGIVKRYGRARFEDVEEKPVVKKVKKEKPVVEVLTCKFPKYNVLSFNQKYEVLRSSGDKVIVIGDNKEESEVLRKRFE